ncbi:MAG TPA: hypothetical protein VH475_23200 [Tepidisphaeraceae bacterium]|jgi:endogenous inhibitor of DNA gyrase (YacG/DUF329 family)
MRPKDTAAFPIGLIDSRERLRNATYRVGETIPLGVNVTGWRYRDCRACGTGFIRRDPRGDVCSVACAQQPGVRKKRHRTGETFVCESCGQSFYRYAADIRKGAAHGSRMRYCSKVCEAVHRAATNVERTCPGCGTKFVVWASRSAGAEANGQQVFCSASCRDRTCAEARRTAVDVRCDACGTNIRRVPARIREHNFCSRDCQASMVHTWASGLRTAVMVPCQTCGALVRRPPSGLLKRVFCSFACERNGVVVPCAACGTPVPRRLDQHRKYAKTFCSRACQATQVHTWTRSGRGLTAKRADVGFTRSRWEANVCRILMAMGLAYEYEPRVFACAGVNYIPDLWVPAWQTWVEVKGWLTPSGAAKIAAFRAAYPEERLVVIDKPVYRAMEREWASRLPAWEFASR